MPLSPYPDWEELIWERTDPKRERLAVLEAMMKTILASTFLDSCSPMD